MFHINYPWSSKYIGQKINLQLFADDPAPAPADPEPTVPQSNEPAPADPKPADPKPTGDLVDEKLYTKKDMEDAVKKAEEETRKLAKMNAEQRQKYELEKAQQDNQKLQQRIAELERDALRAGLSKEAAKTMKEQHGIIATPDMLDLVVGDDADQTNQLIAKLVGIIQEDRKQIEKARATGTDTPRSYGNNDGNTTSEIDKRIAKYQ